MHRLRAWGLSAAALAGTGAASAADPVPATADTRPWYQRVIGGDPKPVPPRPVVVQPLSPEAVAAALKAEQEAFLRRLDVCTQLRMVAEDANDDALRRQCDELERQAGGLFNQRAAALGVKKVKAPLPASAAASLDRALGSGAAVTPLTAPPSPTPADGSRTASLREGRP